MRKITMDFDIVVVGAGPSGLCFAQMLADSGLRIAVLERQAEQTLANPAFDGREIALTHRSAHLLRELGIWQGIDERAISPLRDARVINGKFFKPMLIEHRDTQQSELGYLIANYLIRESAYEAVRSSPAITLIPNAEITKVQTNKDCAEITLSSGQVLESQLLVAADTRFSEMRREMGISSNMHDFGKTMMVCVMEHAVDHQHTAWEWFGYGQTLALLPMNGMRSSVVITLPPQEVNRLMGASEELFNQEMTHRFNHRLGAMRLVSTRHAYPLVTVYSDRFVGKRFALVGDAAVGMHPVTAHGFNFALAGADCLANGIANACKTRVDLASDALLSRYEKTHRHATRPLFMATHAIAKVYSNDKLPVRLARHALLQMGRHVAPFKRAMVNMLTEAH
jgi:ubiquinone biosynthesis UbiH/UbiF/VisC/COQ6 family hydroxylase